MEAVVKLSLENRPEKREASELHPVAALASRAATANLAIDVPIFGELLRPMTRPTNDATIVGVIKAG
jgi:hypothetical protein